MSSFTGIRVLLVLVLTVAWCGVALGAQVHVSVAGRNVELSPSAEYESDRLLAPVAFLESVGVIYHQSNESGILELTLPDGNTAQIKTIVRDKTHYIDVGETAKLLGVQMKLDRDTGSCSIIPVVQSVRYEDGVVNVLAGIPVKYTVSKWSRKLIIDVANASVSGELLKAGPIAVESDYIDKIRVGAYNKTTARTVLDLKKDAPYAVLSSSMASRISVRVGSGKADSGGQLGSSAPAVIDSAEIMDIDGSSFDVSINISKKTKIATSVDTRTATISLSIADAKLADGFVSPSDKHPSIKYVRFSNVSGNPPKVRADIVLSRVMMVEAVAYEGSIAVSVRPFKQSTGSIDQKIIVIDPGHGGNQPGAMGGSVKEKDVNLSIARRLAAALRRAGATVIMTRETDVAVDLASRPQVALDNSAHFFISIHCNSNAFPDSISGTETYYHGWNPSSIYLAKLIQPAVCESTGMKDRGVRSDRKDSGSSGFKVLRLLDSTDIPAVLVETGYLNHSGDRLKLLDPVFQDKLAAGIVEGLRSYIAGEYTR